MPTLPDPGDRWAAHDATTVSIPAPRDLHDALVRERVAPLLRELAALPSLEAVYFERVNKPEWGLRIRVLAPDSRIAGEVRALVRQRLDAMAQPFVFVDDQTEDKWVGGPAEERFLTRIHHLDSLACLDLLDIDGRGTVGTSRAQWSLLVVERLLDLFGIQGVERLEFYRRGFEWAPRLGRWDAEVFSALEGKFKAQADALRATIGASEGGHPPDAWGGAGSAEIAARFLKAARAPIDTVLTAAKSGRLAKPPIDMAMFVAHAHSNRLGIHATQEATIRYLVFRARGGAGPRGS